MPYFELDPLLIKMLDFAPGISDLNLSVGRPPKVELDGQLKGVDYMGIDKLSPYQTEQIAMRLIATALASALAAPAAFAAPAYWTDWISEMSTASGEAGSITSGANTVGVTFTGLYSFA